MARRLTSTAARVRSPSHVSSRLRALSHDRVDLALAGLFVLAAAFCFWRANVVQPLTLDDSSINPYNQLADGFLHLHLWIAHFSSAVLGPEPNNPAVRPKFLTTRYGDDALYHGKIYLTWGPAPVLVLVLPLRLLGFDPSASAIIASFAIVGLGFTFATLRVIVRQVGGVKLWMCILAALVLACSSVATYILKFPYVYHEAIAGGYCFTMIGIWLAVSAIATGGASLARLVLMSLCFGLAAGSRPTLGLVALTLVPVYLSLRATADRRRVLIALTVPVGLCFLLLATYNIARYGSPFEVGTKYQLNGGSYHAHWGEISYLAPGLWGYVMAPPRLSVIFPFFSLLVPPHSYPLHVPASYVSSEETGGLLPLTPIVVFVVALPWIWRRRPGLLGPLGPALLVMMGAGVGILLFLSYEFFGTTERYEVDYATLLLVGALAAWLALSVHSKRRCRWLVRVGGGVLAAWSCGTGLAVCFQGLQPQRSTWRTLVNIGSPLSTAVAAIAGHPILAEVSTPNSAVRPDGIGAIVTAFWLTVRDQAEVTIVSPDSRTATLAWGVYPGAALRAGAPLEASIRDPGTSPLTFTLPVGREVYVPVSLERGVNRLVLTVFSRAEGAITPLVATSESEPLPDALTIVANLHIVND
jgi:hypothetical protein